MFNLGPRFRWYARNRLWNIERDATWLEDMAPYYERAEIVDKYDVPGHLAGETDNLSTFNDPISFELFELARQKQCRSFLDLGCGAGAFYYMLDKFGDAPFTYQGYDVSHAQIERARKRFPASFAVRDVATVTSAEIAAYEAVHMHSVLTFMPAAGQERLLRNIMKTRAWTVLRLNTTDVSLDFVPCSSFKPFGNIVTDENAVLLSAIGFPLRKTVDRIVKLNPGYEAVHRRSEIAVSAAVDPKARQGGCYVRKSTLAGNVQSVSKRFEQERPTMLQCYVTTIKPKGFDLESAPKLDVLR